MQRDVLRKERVESEERRNAQSQQSANQSKKPAALSLSLRQERAHRRASLGHRATPRSPKSLYYCCSCRISRATGCGTGRAKVVIPANRKTQQAHRHTLTLGTRKAMLQPSLSFALTRTSLLHSFLSRFPHPSCTRHLLINPREEPVTHGTAQILALGTAYRARPAIEFGKVDALYIVHCTLYTVPCMYIAQGPPPSL